VAAHHAGVHEGLLRAGHGGAAEGGGLGFGGGENAAARAGDEKESGRRGRRRPL
jgi:hypothetical protein